VAVGTAGKATARLPSGQVGQGRPRRGVIARDRVQRGLGEVALQDVQARAVLVLGRDQQVDPVLADAAHDAERIVAVRALDLLVLALGLQADEVIEGDEVDDPAGGVGAVDHGRAVLEDLGPRHGDRRDVGGILVHPPAVQQDQRLVRAKTAQIVVHRTHQGRAAEVVGLAGRRARDGQALGEFQGRR
jgi:hypothetical protein